LGNTTIPLELKLCCVLRDNVSISKVRKNANFSSDFFGRLILYQKILAVGLHMQDIEKLLRVLKVFLERGDTILMIEHDQSILQYADWVIRLEEGKLMGEG
jgi:excinuclease ABC subunit A